MPTYSTVATDFSGGLMSPHLRGRIDIDKFNKGLQQMENFLPTIQGPAHYREGFEWIREEADGNVRLIDFTINNDSRFLLALSSGLLRIYATDGTLLYTRGGGVDVNGDPVAADDGNGNSVTIPYLNDQVMDVRYSREVETMVFTHPLHPPYSLTANTVYDQLELYSTETSPPDNWALQDSASTPLYAGAVGSEGLWPWAFELVNFTSHPFQKIDTSETVVSLKDESETIRLVADGGSPWGTQHTAAELHLGGGENVAYYVANEWYTEYKSGNQWGLARIIESISSQEVLADPVESVINIEDPAVRTALFWNDDAGGTPPDWLGRDRVDTDEAHVRADALIFRTSHIGSWIRIGGNRLFTNVAEPDLDDYYNSTDGNVRWAKVEDYRGVEDHPVEFLYNELNSGDLDSGTVYEIYDWGATITAISVMDGSGLKEAEDRSAFVRKDVGTPRFTMNAFAISGGTADGTHTLIEPTGAVSSTGMVIANMSTQRQFDVVAVEPTTIRQQGDNLIVPNYDGGVNVSVYDLTNDFQANEPTYTGNLASHTATLTASRIFFDATRDNGRYLLGNLVDKWVLLKVNGNSISSYSAEVDVLTSIPRDELTDDIKNNGVFTQFRWGAWYEDNYPACVSFYEQRRVFAGTRSHPNLVWLSNLNDPTDFRTVEEDGLVLDTTGITYQLGTGSTIISWLEAGPTLIVGTESNEWQLRPNEFSAAITPSNIRITQETSIGSNIQGKRIGGSVFFPHISGKQLHEFKYDFQSQQFVITTTTKLVPDLFEEDPIRTMAYQFNPNSALWIVTETGNLFTLTYRREDDYYAWAKHNSNGDIFKEVVVVPKGDTNNSEDQVWVVVERDGTNQLERMSLTFTDTLADDLRCNARFLDSHVFTDLEASTTEFSVPARCLVDGMVHLVVDGVDLGSVAATEGVNTIPDSVTATDHILVGLPYTGKIQLNPQAFAATGKNSYGQIKRVVSMRPYLYKSMGYKVGFSEDNLEPISPAGGDSLFTGFTEEHTILDSQFGEDETPIIVQDKAYPLTLVSAVLKTDLH